MNKIHYDNVYRASWWVCVVTLPLTTPITSFFSLVLMIVWLADLKYADKWRRIKNSPWVIPFLVFFMLHLAGIAWSDHTGDGFFEVEKKLSFLSFPIIAASGRPLTGSDFNFLSRSFAGSCLLIVIISFVVVVTGIINGTMPPPLNFDPATSGQFHQFNPDASVIWEYFSYIHIGDWIDLHPAYFSMYLIYCITFLGYQSMEAGKIKMMPLTIIVLFTLFTGLLASRIAIISYFAVILYFTIYYVVRRRNLKFFIATSALTAMLAVVIWINPVSRFRIVQEPVNTSYTIDTKNVEWNSVSYRLLEWSASVDIAKTSWLAGVGTGDGQASLQRYYSQFGDNVTVLNYNAHNQYLQTLVELGLPGLFVLLVCIYKPMFTLIQQHPLQIAFIILFGMMCFTESLLARQKGIVFFTMFQSLFYRCTP